MISRNALQVENDCGRVALNSSGFAARVEEEEEAGEDAGAAAVGPLDLAGHEATGQDVDALENPDGAHDGEAGGEDGEGGAHGWPFGCWC